MEVERINLKIQEYLGHLPTVEKKILGSDGFYIWKPGASPIWIIQHVNIPTELGRMVVREGNAMVTPGTFQNPMPEGFKEAENSAAFCEDVAGISYLRQSYLTEKLVAEKVALEVRRLPDDRSLEKFTPEVTYKGLFSKVTSRVFSEDTKLVKVRAKVIETGETIEIQIPASEAAALNLQEFKG